MLTGEREYLQAQEYAAKLSADTLGQGIRPDLSTDGIMAALANCVRPARRSEVGQIREIFLAEFARA